MEKRDPFIQFNFRRFVPWFKVDHHAGRFYFWTKFFAVSIGKRWPTDDGWPEK